VVSNEQTKTTQIKFTIDSDIVSEFKARCAKEGVSMTSAVRQFMENCQLAKEMKVQPMNRPLRRKAVMDIIRLLNAILELETDYCDKIPENFSQKQEDAEHACEQLAEAIACLEDAF
jgi:antitoxin component of RelBE/YafQ-DinJ toxin-antitoxin module